MALTTIPASLSATALTLTTAAQPNITSVGTLTGLTLSGNLTVNANTNVTGNLTVDTNSFYVDATNNRVGIGTTTPYKKLEVIGDIQLHATDANIWLRSGTTGTNGFINWTFNTDDTVFNKIGIDYDTRATTGFHIDAGYPITIDASASGGKAINFAIAGATKAIIDGTGNAGIGTTDPLALLNVVRGGSPGLSSVNARTVALFENNNSAGTTISINAPATGYAGIFFGDDSSETVGQIKHVNSDNSLQFVTQGAATEMTLKAGELGIGTTSPATALHVVGTTTFDGDGASRAEINSSTASSVVSLNVGGFTGTPSVARDVRFFVNAAANTRTERMRIENNGRVLIGKTSTGLANAGVEFEGGQIKGTAANQTVAYLNRTGSDGDVIQFRRDNTPFGEISKSSTRFTIEGPDNPVRIATGTSNIQINHDTHITFDVANSEAMRITALRDVSIGSNHSGFTGWKVLNIRGESTGGMLNFENSSGTRSFTFANQGSGMRYQAHISGGYHRFETNAQAYAMYINNAGYVGVGGTASPMSRFQVGSHTFSGSNGMYQDSRVGMSNHGSLTGLMLATTYNDANYPDYGLVFVAGPSTSSYNCWNIAPDGPAKGNRLNFHYQAQSSNIHVAPRMASLDGSGNFYPAGDVVMAQGKGINFGNAADVATGETVRSSILDDYEEGVFTPDIRGTSATGSFSPSNANGGFYIKVGRMVQCWMNVTGTLSGASGSMRVHGLPFTTASNNATNATNAVYSTGSLQYWSGSGADVMGPLNYPGTNYVYFHTYNGSSTGGHPAVSNGTQNLHCFVCYYIN